MYGVVLIATYLVATSRSAAREPSTSTPPVPCSRAPSGIGGGVGLPARDPSLSWQWFPTFDTIAFARSDPSTHRAYYQPLLEFLDNALNMFGRVEYR